MYDDQKRSQSSIDTYLCESETSQRHLTAGSLTNSKRFLGKWLSRRTVMSVTDKGTYLRSAINLTLFSL